MIKTCMDNVREKAPLVHNITNYVTVNDVANVLLACGGSPIMSDEPDDVEDITSICVGLNINIGTLNKRTIESMFLAGKKSKALGHVLLLDPVGRGKQAADGNGREDFRRIETGRDPREYFRDQDAGFGKRHHQGRGRRCS